jgi:hypothetical protein
MNIDFSKETMITEANGFIDGGTLQLKCVNQGQSFIIEIMQSAILQMYDWEERISGRLYLNGVIVEQRSDLENQIIENIRNSNQSNLDKLDIRMVNEKIDYIKSNEYLTDQLKVKR